MGTQIVVKYLRKFAFDILSINLQILSTMYRIKIFRYFDKLGR